jgi:hypothetical protein
MGKRLADRTERGEPAAWLVRVLIALPEHDFDVTEVSVPWRLLANAGHDTVFATEHGGFAPEADKRLLDGVMFGRLGAYEEPKATVLLGAGRPYIHSLLEHTQLRLLGPPGTRGRREFA